MSRTTQSLSAADLSSERSQSSSGGSGSGTSRRSSGDAFGLSENDPPPPSDPYVKASQEARARDPQQQKSLLTPVLDMGRDTVKVGLALGVLVALIPHTYASVSAETSLLDMLHWVQESRGPINDYLWTFYDIDVPKTEPKKEDVAPEVQPPPPEPPPQQAPPKVIDPYKDAPPPQAAAPAKADDIYSAKDNGQKPLAFPDMVDNDGGQGAGFGKVSNDGSGTKPVTGPTTPNGKGDGNNTGPGNGNGTAPAAQGPDKSKPPTLVGSTAWNCPFPPEADAEGQDSAMATIIVKVRPDGSPQSVSIVSDPGFGFGRAAKTCALTRRFSAGLDRDGNPTTSSTPPIRVKFSR